MEFFESVMGRDFIDEGRTFFYNQNHVVTRQRVESVAAEDAAGLIEALYKNGGWLFKEAIPVGERYTLIFTKTEVI